MGLGLLLLLIDYDLSSHLPMWICECAADCLHLGSSFPSRALQGCSADALCKPREGTALAETGRSQHRKGLQGEPLTPHPSLFMRDGCVFLSFVMQSLSHFLQFN